MKVMRHKEKGRNYTAVLEKKKNADFIFKLGPRNLQF